MRSTNSQQDIFRQDVYILGFDFENTIENQEFHFLTQICEIRSKR